MANYQIVGWAEYDDFLRHLRRLGIAISELRSEWCETSLVTPDEERALREQGLQPVQLRRASFVHPLTGSNVFIEEYIRKIRYRRDGQPNKVVVETVQYRAGERPPLRSWIDAEWA